MQILLKKLLDWVMGTLERVQVLSFVVLNQSSTSLLEVDEIQIHENTKILTVSMQTSIELGRCQFPRKVLGCCRSASTMIVVHGI